MATYEDAGVAGDELKKRPEFRRMLADALAGLFDMILVDDKDRFGRFDSQQDGHVTFPLREAGIELMTVTTGLVDWESFAGRITSAAVAEAKAQQSRDTSYRVLTQFIGMARDGYHLGGPVPYGYKAVGREKNGKIVEKRLVPGDPTHVKVVQWLFETYATKDVSTEWLATELDKRGVAPPTTGRRHAVPVDGSDSRPLWRKQAIGGMLRNRKYVGDWVWNKQHLGKHHEMASGEVKKRRKRDARRVAAKEDWIIIPNNHPHLIDRELFETVQAKLAGNKRLTTPHVARGKFLLTGLLVCAHCGFGMLGFDNTNHKHRASRRPSRSYVCGGYHTHGARKCSRNSIIEKHVLDCVIRKLQDEFLNPENLEKLRAELRRQVQEGSKSTRGDVQDVQRRLAALDQKIARGVENMLSLPVEFKDQIPALAATMDKWKDERAALVKQTADLGALNDDVTVEAIDRAVDLAEQKLWELREALASGEPAMVRAVLQELLSRVELWFEKRQLPKQTRTAFSRGIIYLKPDQQMLRLGKHALPLKLVGFDGSPVRAVLRSAADGAGG